MDRRGQNEQKARGAAARLGRRHEGARGRALYPRLGSLARHGAGRRHLRLSQGFRRSDGLNGSVGLYHIENLTPEAVEQGAYLLKENVQTYVIDDAELERVRKSYPVIWKNPDAKPKLCFIGCPHLTFSQLNDWTDVWSRSSSPPGAKRSPSAPSSRRLPPFWKNSARRSVLNGCAPWAWCSPISAR